jgi:tetratricopeptide (TPR) repeat protein
MTDLDPLNRQKISIMVALSLALALIIPSSFAASAGKTEGENPLEEPIAYIPEALGDYRWDISTNNDAAQNYFNQGMQLRWAYNMPESARSLAQARRIDPNCAMCFWGEAFALGSFLNSGTSKAKAARAHVAINKALSLSIANATQIERDIIQAALVRYPKDYDPSNRRPVDQAFADAMSKVHAKYPNDHNVAAVYGVALFLLENRRGYRDLQSPSLKKLHDVLTGVLNQDLTHPGACHLYIHATESSQDPGLALPCAEHLADAVPAASHIQHMPSHTWNEVGLWGKSVIANTKAQHADLKASFNKGFSYGSFHNLHMLLFAASFDGQGAVATQAGKDYRKLTGDSLFEVLTLIRFGRFDEVLENKRRPKSEASAAMFDFAQGYAHLKSGNPDEAKVLSKQVLELAATTNAKVRFHSAKSVVGTLAHILAGEILAETGDYKAAIAEFERAVKLEDSLGFDEPEPLPFAARHWLGSALYKDLQFGTAEQVYREELKDHPNNGWSLFGLNQSLVAQGKINHEVAEALTNSWARADIWIIDSKF